MTGELIVHLPGAGPPSVDSGPLQSGASASAFEAAVTDGCVLCAGSLAGCISSRVDDGMLKGDPVSGFGLDIVDVAASGSADVSVTVFYN